MAKSLAEATPDNDYLRSCEILSEEEFLQRRLNRIERLLSTYKGGRRSSSDSLTPRQIGTRNNRLRPEEKERGATQERSARYLHASALLLLLFITVVASRRFSEISTRGTSVCGVEPLSG